MALLSSRAPLARALLAAMMVAAAGCADDSALSTGQRQQCNEIDAPAKDEVAQQVQAATIACVDLDVQGSRCH
ncbi:MAG: hypothetical protein NVSMB6_25450 [Burkholderiaceae bacterium]